MFFLHSITSGCVVKLSYTAVSQSVNFETQILLLLLLLLLQLSVGGFDTHTRDYKINLLPRLAAIAAIAGAGKRYL